MLLPERAPLLTIPPKTSTDVAWVEVLSKQIAQIYNEDPNKYKREILALRKMRDDMCGAVDLGGKSMVVLLRYFAQLDLLELHFSFNEASAINGGVFSWTDAFSRNESVQTAMAFEKACVIFNIAAILSHGTSVVAIDLKRVYRDLQMSAGLFQFINDNFLHAPSFDLSPSCIRFLSDLMLAQAQEILFVKTVNPSVASGNNSASISLDKKTSRLGTKLAAGLAKMYAALGGVLAADSKLSGSLPRIYTSLVPLKAKYYSGFAQILRAPLFEADLKYGEMISALEYAASEFKDCAKLVSKLPSSTSLSLSSSGSKGSLFVLTPLDSLKEFAESVKKCAENSNDQLIKARRENDLMYFASVVPRSALPPLDPLIVPEKLGFDAFTGEEKEVQALAVDIFKALIPLDIHEKASIYSEQKAQIMREIKKEQESVDDILKATTSSVNDIEFNFSVDKSTVFDGINKVQLKQLRPEVATKLQALESDHTMGLLQTSRDISNDICGTISIILKAFDGFADNSNRQPSKKADDYMNLKNLMDETIKIQKDFESTAVSVINYKTGALNMPTFKKVETFSKSSKREVKSTNLLDNFEEQNAIETAPGILAKMRLLVTELNSAVEDGKKIANEMAQAVQEDDINELLVLNSKQNVYEHIFKTELEKFDVFRENHSKVTIKITSITPKISDLIECFKKMPEYSAVSAQKESFNQYSDEIERIYEKRERLVKQLGESVDRLVAIQDQVSLIKERNSHLFVTRREEFEQTSHRPEISQAQQDQDALRAQLMKLKVTPVDHQNTQDNRGYGYNIELPIRPQQQNQEDNLIFPSYPNVYLQNQNFQEQKYDDNYLYSYQQNQIQRPSENNSYISYDQPRYGDNQNAVMPGHSNNAYSGGIPAQVYPMQPNNVGNYQTQNPTYYGAGTQFSSIGYPQQAPPGTAGAPPHNVVFPQRHGNNLQE